MIEGWVPLLLLLYFTAVTGNNSSCTDEGAVVIFGTVTDTLITGRLEICAEGFWKGVLDDSWHDIEARIVCQRKGFPPEGTNSIAACQKFMLTEYRSQGLPRILFRSEHIDKWIYSI